MTPFDRWHRTIVIALSSYIILYHFRDIQRRIRRLPFNSVLG